MKKLTPMKTGVTIALLSMSASGAAHEGHQLADHTLVSGLLHPLTGIAHLVGLLGLGGVIGVASALWLREESDLLPILLLSVACLVLSVGKANGAFAIGFFASSLLLSGVAYALGKFLTKKSSGWQRSRKF